MILSSKATALRALLYMTVAGPVVLAAGAAGAQEPQQPTARSLSGLAECRAIESDAERLACYDRVVDTAGLADRDRQFVAVDVEEAEAVERDAFGLDLPSLPSFSLSLFSGGENDLETDSAEPDAADSETQSADAQSGAPTGAPAEPRETRVVERDDEGQVERVAMTVDRVRQPGYNTLLVHMANGQVWEVTERGDKGRIARRIERGEFVEIRRGAIGSYFLEVDGRGIAYRVRRSR